MKKSELKREIARLRQEIIDLRQEIIDLRRGLGGPIPDVYHSVIPHVNVIPAVTSGNTGLFDFTPLPSASYWGTVAINGEDTVVRYREHTPQGHITNSQIVGSVKAGETGTGHAKTTP